MKNVCWDGLDFHYEEPSEEYLREQCGKIDESLRKFCGLVKIDYKRISINVRTIKQIIVIIDQRRLYFSIYHHC